MEHAHARVSESRTFVVITSFGRVVKFRLPKVLPNEDVIAASYFLKYLELHEVIMLCTSYETLKCLKEIEKLPLFKSPKLEMLERIMEKVEEKNEQNNLSK